MPGSPSSTCSTRSRRSRWRSSGSGWRLS